MSGVLRAISVFAAAVCIIAWAGQAHAQDDELDLVNEARETMQKFTSDPDMDALIDLVPDAEGVLIVPTFYKAGFLIGGSGGKGVLLVRDEDTGRWTGPAFYNLGAASGGLQVGFEVAEVVILAMTREAVEDLYGSAVKLGADASIAAGPVGAGAQTSTGPVPKTAFISFAKSQGAYLGLTLEGSLLKVDEDSNLHYYGSPVRPMDIFVKRRTSGGPGAAGLIDAVRQADIKGGEAE